MSDLCLIMYDLHHFFKIIKNYKKMLPFNINTLGFISFYIIL